VSFFHLLYPGSGPLHFEESSGQAVSGPTVNHDQLYWGVLWSRWGQPARGTRLPGPNWPHWDDARSVQGTL